MIGAPSGAGKRRGPGLDYPGTSKSKKPTAMSNSNVIEKTVNRTRITKTMVESSARRPKMMSVDFNSVPEALKQRTAWVAWRWILSAKKNATEKKWTKVPQYWAIWGRAETEVRNDAQSNNPNTWHCFEKVFTKLALYDELSDLIGCDQILGVGFVFEKSFGITGVDLDNCRDPATGAIEPWAMEIVHRLNSYTEVSPSGTGVKICLFANKPGPRCKRKDANGEIEIYDHFHFFTVTGNHLAGTPIDLQPRQAELDALYTETFTADLRTEGKDAAQQSAVISRGAAVCRLSLTDNELISKAMTAPQTGDDFTALWNGDTSVRKGDESAADYALAHHLAFWTSKDHARILSLLWQSGLRRGKWQRKDYLDRTVKRAIENCTRCYGDGHFRRDDELELPPGTTVELVPAKQRGPKRDHAGPRWLHTEPGGDGARLMEDDGLNTEAARTVARQVTEETERQRLESLAWEKAQFERWNRFACPRPSRGVIYSPFTETVKIAATRCDRWDCPGCGALKRECHRDNFRLRLARLLGADTIVFCAAIPKASFDRIKKRIQRHDGNYFRFGTKSDETHWIVATVPVFVDFGQEKLTAAAAADQLCDRVSRYFEVGDKPVSASVPWKLPGRPSDDEGLTGKNKLIGKICDDLRGPEGNEKIEQAALECEYVVGGKRGRHVESRVQYWLTFAPQKGLSPWRRSAQRERFFAFLDTGELLPLWHFEQRLAEKCEQTAERDDTPITRFVRMNGVLEADLIGERKAAVFDDL